MSPDANVLSGVSRRTMMELAGMAGIEGRLAPLSPEALRNADEAFIPSTSCGLMPETRVDRNILGNNILGNGAPEPVTARLLGLYYRKKDEGWMITPIPSFERRTSP